MTTAKPRAIAKHPAIAKPKPPPAPAPFRLPDPPEDRYDEKMTSAKHLGLTGSFHHLIHHLGNPETTIVGTERYLVATPVRNMAGSRYPDLLIALNVDPEAYERSNGYIIDEQGKPPDFVLEIASPSTGIIDVTTKRADYAAMGILEYWRFDETGEHHGARLAGDRLVGGRYVPIPIDPLPGDILQGHSLALNLLLRWEQRRLGWHDPATGWHITTLVSALDRADRAEARADHAEAARDREQAARIHERDRADRAEARANRQQTQIRQMQQRIQQLEARNGSPPDSE